MNNLPITLPNDSNFSIIEAELEKQKSSIGKTQIYNENYALIGSAKRDGKSWKIIGIWPQGRELLPKI